MVYICKSRKGEELDGFERHTDNIRELLELLEQYKETHIQTTEGEEIDLWIKC